MPKAKETHTNTPAAHACQGRGCVHSNLPSSPTSKTALTDCGLTTNR